MAIRYPKNIKGFATDDTTLLVLAFERNRKKRWTEKRNGETEVKRIDGGKD